VYGRRLAKEQHAINSYIISKTCAAHKTVLLYAPHMSRTWYHDSVIGHIERYSKDHALKSIIIIDITIYRFLIHE